MIDMEILPFEGFPEVRFGESRQSLREALGMPLPFRRAASSPVLSDAYDVLGMILGYDDRDLLYLIEVATPAAVKLRGVRLLDRPHAEVLAELHSAGLSVVQSGTDWVVSEMGIVLGNPHQDDPGDFRSVLISSRTQVVHDFSFFEGEGQIGPGEFEVEPRGGFGAVRLGAAREEVRQLLGSGMVSVPEFGAVWQDHFFSVGAVVGYDSEERVIRIVVTRPAQVVHRGMELLGRPCGEIKTEARRQGVAVIEREAELYFPESGFSLWTARAGDDALPVIAAAFVHQGS
ncbi:hypothetical protein ABT115_24150 [Streptomyces sp. NPDC001832]|uniref:hypothetical protein n=1 Tax=Streptomyces sp. NPDC001832 TaxID=3154527 RepID=UPI00332B64F7